MNKVKVLFFAVFRDLVGERQVWLDIPDNLSVNGFKELIASKYPATAEYVHYTLIAVNSEFSEDDDLIPFQAEIAVFPPVSGG